MYASRKHLARCLQPSAEKCLVLALSSFVGSSTCLERKTDAKLPPSEIISAEAAVTYLDNLDKVPVPFVTSESVDFYNSQANKRSEGETFSFHLLGSSLFIHCNQSAAGQSLISASRSSFTLDVFRGRSSCWNIQL